MAFCAMQGCGAAARDDGLTPICTDDTDQEHATAKRKAGMQSLSPLIGRGEKIFVDECFGFGRTTEGLVAGGRCPAGDGGSCVSGVCTLSGASVFDATAGEAGDRCPAGDECL